MQADLEEDVQNGQVQYTQYTKLFLREDIIETWD